jgi:photosystem II stability/assembly factor-like uncharacterized protein
MKKSIYNQKLITILLCIISVNLTIIASVPKWNVTIKGSKNSDYFKSIAVINDDTVYVITNTSKILKTTNAGINWTTTNLPTWNAGSQPRAVNFANAKVGYVAGDNSIAKTVDYGKTWTKLTDLGVGIGISSVYAKNADTCYFGAKGSVYYTYDGGKTIQSTSVSAGLSSLYVNKNGTIYRGGSDGGIYKSVNNALSFKGVFSKTTTNFIDNQISSLYFSDENIGYIVGLKKTGEAPFINNILKTTNGGLVWTGNPIGVSSTVNSKGPTSVCIPSNGIGYVVGLVPNEGDIYIWKTTDAGATFVNDSDGAIATDYYSVAITPRGDVYIAGNGCVLTRKAIAH